MYEFVLTIVGSEEAILDYLGVPHNYKDYMKLGKVQYGVDAEDEAFDEEDEEEESSSNFM
jgi:hypothetical protein